MRARRTAVRLFSVYRLPDYESFAKAHEDAYVVGQNCRPCRADTPQQPLLSCSFNQLETRVDAIGFLIVALIVMFPLWRIFKRAGFNPALSLLVFVPWVGFLIVSAILAFGEWPSLRRERSA
jgi:hypothetical protein